MITYLNYFNSAIKDLSAKEIIGIILGAEKDDIFVGSATAMVSNKLSVGEYQNLTDYKWLVVFLKVMMNIYFGGVR